MHDSVSEAFNSQWTGESKLNRWIFSLPAAQDLPPKNQWLATLYNPCCWVQFPSDGTVHRGQAAAMTWTVVVTGHIKSYSRSSHLMTCRRFLIWIHLVYPLDANESFGKRDIANDRLMGSWEPFFNQRFAARPLVMWHNTVWIGWMDWVPNIGIGDSDQPQLPSGELR